jgi:hypothetical protein
LGNPACVFMRLFPQFNCFHQILQRPLVRFIPKSKKNADRHYFNNHHGGRHHDLL